MADSWTHFNAAERKSFFHEHEVDCRFLVGMEGKENLVEFKSYKFILTNISPVFESMFNGDIKEHQATNDLPSIIINDLPAKDFDNFLQMAYHREVKRKGIDWKGIYCVAKKYLAETIIGLVICELGHYIICNPNPIDNLNFFEIVHIEGKKTLFCPSMGNPIKKAFKMHCFQIYRLDRNVFKSLCAFVNKIEPLVRFRVVENYCALNDIERCIDKTSEENEFIESCLELIDFSALSLREFTDFIENSNLLILNEKYDILLKISKKLAYNLCDFQIDSLYNVALS